MLPLLQTTSSKDYPQVLEITQSKPKLISKGDNKLTTHNYMLEGQDNYREGVNGLKTGTTELQEHPLWPTPMKMA